MRMSKEGLNVYDSSYTTISAPSHHRCLMIVFNPSKVSQYLIDLHLRHEYHPNKTMPPFDMSQSYNSSRNSSFLPTPYFHSHMSRISFHHLPTPKRQFTVYPSIHLVNRPPHQPYRPSPFRSPKPGSFTRNKEDW